MANITRIKAKDSGDKDKRDESEAEEITRKVSVKAKNSENKKVKEKKKAAAKAAEKADKKKAKKTKKSGDKARKSDEEVGYFRGAFREIRQVRWPNRKLTWKLTLTVIGYIVLVAVFLMLLDAFFTFIFNQLLGGN